MGVSGGGVDIVSNKGCSRFRFRGIQSFDPLMSPASSSSVASRRHPAIGSDAPFNGLVICVTGLSKEARRQVKDATERLGGQYSPNLHPQCTHLIVQSFGGRKLEHALKHGCRSGLFVVTIGWFVDSVRKNVRLSESLYCVRNVSDNGMCFEESNQLSGFMAIGNSCLPVGATKQAELNEEPHMWFCGRESSQIIDKPLSGYCLYLDPDISTELQNKVVEAATREGAKFVDKWFVGCKATHVVCEGTAIQRYLGHAGNLVTPLWVLKTAKNRHMQRLIHMSPDLARQMTVMLENNENNILGEDLRGENFRQAVQSCRRETSHEERQQIVNLAKNGVRNRRNRKMQTCQTPVRPITPSTLLDSICWSISEPPSTASIYTDSFSAEDVNEHHPSVFLDPKGDSKESESSFSNLTRPLSEREKSELIFKEHILTILFPIDRFAEMGPSSRTFFCNEGFTCLQVLNHIYAFYQESMSLDEIEVAIHTDSRHADRLRAVYSSKETPESSHLLFKRIDFLGSRKSLEMLKRVSGDNNNNVYEVLIRA